MKRGIVLNGHETPHCTKRTWNATLYLTDMKLRNAALYLTDIRLWNAALYVCNYMHMYRFTYTYYLYCSVYTCVVYWCTDIKYNLAKRNEHATFKTEKYVWLIDWYYVHCTHSVQSAVYVRWMLHHLHKVSFDIRHKKHFLHLTERQARKKSSCFNSNFYPWCPPISLNFRQYFYL